MKKWQVATARGAVPASSGEEHRARIELPNGFEYKKAEMANVARLEVTAPEPLAMRHQNTYAQLNELDRSNV